MSWNEKNDQKYINVRHLIEPDSKEEEPARSDVQEVQHDRRSLGVETPRAQADQPDLDERPAPMTPPERQWDMPPDEQLYPDESGAWDPAAHRSDQPEEDEDFGDLLDFMPHDDSDEPEDVAMEADNGEDDMVDSLRLS